MFKITVEESKVVRKLLNREWKLLGPEDNSVYGYAPEIDGDVKESKVIFEQSVDTLDICALIAAINKKIRKTRAA